MWRILLKLLFSLQNMRGKSNSHFFFFYTKPSPTVQLMCKREIFFSPVRPDTQAQDGCVLPVYFAVHGCSVQVQRLMSQLLSSVDNCFTGKQAIKWNKG